MKTLTITDAKKNLGQWLKAAARGEDVGIISGADIIALRKVQVAPVGDDYAYAVREYGVTPKQVEQLHKRVDVRYRELRRNKKLVTLSPSQVKEMVEKSSQH